MQIVIGQLGFRNRKPDLRRGDLLAHLFQLFRRQVGLMGPILLTPLIAAQGRAIDPPVLSIDATVPAALPVACTPLALLLPPRSFPPL